MEAISAQDFLERRNSDPNIWVLDVRTADEVLQERLTGLVIFSPLDDMEKRMGLLENAKNSGEPIFVLCHTDNRSRIAAEILEKHDFPKVFVVLGGMVELKSLGAEIERIEDCI